jgi:starch synthase
MRFARDFAERIDRLLGDPEEARRLGEAGRRRAVDEFGWPAIAEEVEALYRRVVAVRAS